MTPTPDPMALHDPYNGWDGLLRDMGDHPLIFGLIGLVLIGLIVIFLVAGADSAPPSNVSRGRYQGPDRQYPFQAWLDDEQD